MKAIGSGFSSVMDAISIDSTDTISGQGESKADSNDSLMKVIVIDDQEEQLLSNDVDLTQDAIGRSRSVQRVYMKNDYDSVDVIEITDEDDCSSIGIQHEGNSHLTALAKLHEALNQYSDHAEDESSSSETQTMNPWICSYCEKTFKNYETFDQHLRNEHIHINDKESSAPNNDSKLKCNVCNEYFNDKDFLKHRLMHSRKRNSELRVFYCAECSEMFSSNDELKSHYEKKHSKEMLQETDDEIQCTTCELLFESSALLNEHIKTHTSQQRTDENSKVHGNQNINELMRFECTGCSKKFSSSADLRNHMKIHQTTVTPVQSSKTCKETYIAREICQQIYNCQEQTRQRFACNSCSASFETRKGLSCHQKRLHYDTTPAYACNDVPETFHYKYQINSPGNIHPHVPKDLVSCHVCSMTFPNRKGLNYHMRSHVSRYFQCEMCTEKFVSYSKLTSHKANHVVHHVCDFCSSAYVSRETLNKHLESCGKIPTEFQVSTS